MIKYSKYLDALNIITGVIVIIKYALQYFVGLSNIYNSFGYLFSGVLLIIAISNIVISVLKIKNKNITSAILDILTGIVLIITAFISSMTGVLICVWVIMILSGVNLVHMKGLYDNAGLDTDKKEVIIFITVIIIEMILFIVPIVMNIKNVENFNAAQIKIRTEKSISSEVTIEDGEYVFKNARGKELSKHDYDEVSEDFDFIITVNFKTIRLGVAKDGNKVIIINTSGEEMFTLCNLFDDYEKVAANFKQYLVDNNKVH